jgi:arylsulfatase A-like enzyme
MHDYNTSVPTFYKQLREAGYWTMTTGKDDLTKGTQMGSITKPPYKGCDACLDGDGLYHQEELGWSDGRRFQGKLGVFQHWPEPYCMYGYHLRNQTVHLENGTALTGWEAHAACVKQSNDEHESPLCDARSYPQELYEDDFTAQMAIELLQSWKANHSNHSTTTRTHSSTGARGEDTDDNRTPFFLHVSFPGPHPPFAVTAPMHDRVAGVVWPNATDDTKYPQSNGGICTATHEPSTIMQSGRCDYAAEILNIDDLFRKVLNQVEEMGEMERTIVCMSSDHGELLGDHNDFGKSMPWQSAVGVPLV